MPDLYTDHLYISCTRGALLFTFYGRQNEGAEMGPGSPTEEALGRPRAYGRLD